MKNPFLLTVIVFRSYWVFSLLSLLSYFPLKMNGWAERSMTVVIPASVFALYAFFGELAIRAARSGDKVGFIFAIFIASLNFIFPIWLFGMMTFGIMRKGFPKMGPGDWTPILSLWGIAGVFLVLGGMVLYGLIRSK